MRGPNLVTIVICLVYIASKNSITCTMILMAEVHLINHIHLVSVKLKKKLKLSSHMNPLPQTKKTVRLYIFQKRIGCFNHRVVILAGYTLTRDMVVMRGSLRLNYRRPLVIIVMTIVGGIPEGRCMLWHHSPNSLVKSLGTRLLGVST